MKYTIILMRSKSFD